MLQYTHIKYTFRLYVLIYSINISNGVNSAMDNYKQIITEVYNNPNQHNYSNDTIREAINVIISTLDCGGIRVAEKSADEWITHQWIKQAILLSFRINKNQTIDAGYTKFHDKLELKFKDYSPEMFQHESIRIVPQAIARRGAYIGKNSILMPSYVNIGAYIGENTMIDTWATIGSCAQIGNRVHISGGVGIGGVLEPLQANPTIIEDDCFIGARSEIVEGVIVEQGSVISMGVYIGQSTKIYNRETGEISYGRIPAYSVVIPGNIPHESGKYGMYAAIIIKQVDAQTRSKVAINEILREV